MADRNVGSNTRNSSTGPHDDGPIDRLPQDPVGDPTSSRPGGVTVAAFSPRPTARMASAASVTTRFAVDRRCARERSKNSRSAFTPHTCSSRTGRTASSNSWPVGIPGASSRWAPSVPARTAEEARVQALPTSRTLTLLQPRGHIERAVETLRSCLSRPPARCVFDIALRRLGVNQPVWAPDAGRHRRRAWGARRSRTARSSDRRTTTPDLFVSSRCTAQDGDCLPRTRHTSTAWARHHRKWCDVGSSRGIRHDRCPVPAARIQPICGAPCEDRVEPRGTARWPSPTSPNPPHLLRPFPVVRPDRVRLRHPPVLRPDRGATRRPLRRDSLARHRREHDNAHHRDERTHGHTRCCNLRRNSELHQRINPRGLGDGVHRIQQQRR